MSIADRKTKRGAAPSPKEVAAAAAKGEKIATKRPDAPQQTMSVADYFFKTYRIKVDPVRILSPPTFRVRAKDLD